MWEHILGVTVAALAAVGTFTIIKTVIRLSNGGEVFPLYHYKDLDDCPCHFKVWAFGDKYYFSNPYELMITWNQLHGETLTLSENDLIEDSLRKMREIYDKLPRTWSSKECVLNK